LELINNLGEDDLDAVIESSEYIHTLKVDRILDLYNARCNDSE
jgi:hypothetical protein